MRKVSRRPAWVLAALLLPGAMSTARAGLPKVPEGFKVRSVASVPAVVYPCQVATAPDGSLFIAEDPMDQVGPYESNHGKILRVRDGQEPTLFAEGFRAIFGMAWRNGALYVSHMPYLTVLRDTDGDGKADSRTELFKDLGITDNKGLNDHIVSGLQFGIDGYLYITTGDKGIYHATGPDGRTAQVVGGGVVRCRPDGTGIEVLSTGTRNHLEPNLDDRDNLFTYDNTDDGDGWWTRVSHHVDGAYFGYPYDYHDHPDRFLNRMAEYASGSPCGGLVYKEDAWPESFRGRAFWAEWGKRAVRGFRFRPEGASFQVADVIEMAQPDGQGEFRPIDLALSYDGKTLYVADWGMGGWGNKAEKVGRVYAIEYEGPPIATRPRGQDSDPIDAQIRQLDHPSFNERTRAQLALIKAGPAALGTITQALADPKTDPVARRHLIWVVDGIAGGTDAGDAALLATLNAEPADIRAQAARALGERSRSSAVVRLIERTHDADPTVRLQAIIALGRIGDARAVATLVPILADPDRYLAFSARQALRRIGDWDAVAAQIGAASPELRTALIAAMETVEQVGAVRGLARISGSPTIPAAERARALTSLAVVHHLAPPWDGKWWGTRPTKGKPPARTIAWEGTPLVLAATRGALADADPAVRVAAVRAAREIDDRDARPALRARFAEDADPTVRREVAATLGTMHDGESVPALVAALQNGKTNTEVRDAALEAVEMIGSPEATAGLAGVLAAEPLAGTATWQVRLIDALGRLKATSALGAVADRLAATEAPVRVAATRAVGEIGKNSDVQGRLLPLLADPDLAVRNAAIETTARLGLREAIPTLIEAAGATDTEHEATLALAKLGDLRALPVYLRGLAARSPEVRQATADALLHLREKAEPALAQLASRRELPAASLPELRRIFAPLTPIGGWHVVGPFEAMARPPVPLNQPVDLGAELAGADGKKLTWQPVPAPADGRGTLDLAALFPKVGDASVFATVVIPKASARPARLEVTSTQAVNVWLNGKDILKAEGPRMRRGVDQTVNVDLPEGENRLLVRLTHRSDPWTFAARLSSPEGPAFLAGPPSGGFDAAAYRQAARDGRGDIKRGRDLFFDLKGMACSKCHAVGGQGGAVGPDLSGVAVKYPRDEIITSILEPSARISSGYEPVNIATNDGRVLTGLVKSETADKLEIEDAEARRLTIPKADIEERRTSELSLMPAGLVEGVSARDFADLVAYLDTLKDQATPAPKAPTQP